MTQDEVRYGTQRAAAARNRAVILDAAHDLLADNPNASMNEIAKRAGVGAGTLYRHFPTREDLLLAAYRHDVQRLVDSVADRLATLPPGRPSSAGSRTWPVTSGSSTASARPCTPRPPRKRSTRPTSRSPRRSANSCGPPSAAARCAQGWTPGTSCC